MIPENDTPDLTLMEMSCPELLILASADMSGHLNHQGNFSGIQSLFGKIQLAKLQIRSMESRSGMKLDNHPGSQVGNSDTRSSHGLAATE
jgi:hypothetical protein